MIYTLGPWRAEANNFWGFSVRAPSVKVRSLAGKEEDAFVAHRLKSMADARLIAAAPEMYEVLKDAVESEEGATVTWRAKARAILAQVNFAK